MVLLKDALRKRIAHKHLGHNMIGAISVNTVIEIFRDKLKMVDEKRNLQWYVRFNKLFLKTSDQKLKIEFFKQKSQILAKINLALEKVGYRTRLVEIILK